jgi:ABC-type amino acid transport substrate-binding protein
VAVVADSPGADVAAAALPPDAIRTPLATPDDVVAAVRDGSVDAAILDGPLAGYLALTDDSLAVTETIPTPARYGLATDAGRSALLAEVDAALAELRTDGTLDQLTATWFGT